LNLSWPHGAIPISRLSLSCSLRCCRSLLVATAPIRRRPPRPRPPSTHPYNLRSRGRIAVPINLLPASLVPWGPLSSALLPWGRPLSAPSSLPPWCRGGASPSPSPPAPPLILLPIRRVTARRKTSRANLEGQRRPRTGERDEHHTRQHKQAAATRQRQSRRLIPVIAADG